MATEKYFASVRYQAGMEINNTELNVLRNLACNHEGSIYERASNSQARLIAFTFPSKPQADEFKQASEKMEKIVQVRVGKL